MIAAARAGLELSVVATTAMACWLVIVVLTILPTRSPEFIPLWVIVAVVAFALATVSVVAIRCGRPSTALSWVLGSVAALGGGFGIAFVFMYVELPDADGYLLAIGSILLLNWVLAFVWLAARQRRFAR